MQSDNSKGDHHHEAEESESASKQHGAAAARADRFDRRPYTPKHPELLAQRNVVRFHVGYLCWCQRWASKRTGSPFHDIWLM